MESVAGGHEAAREEDGEVDCGWIAHGPSPRRRPTKGAIFPDKPAPAAPPSPLGTATPVVGGDSSSSALSTEPAESGHERFRSTLIGACILVAGFLFGAALMAERSGPIPYQAVAVKGDAPVRALKNLEMCEGQLRDATEAVDAMNTAAGFAAAQLSQCWKAIGR